jgi:RNA polymerase primary sigma factor
MLNRTGSKDGGAGSLLQVYLREIKGEALLTAEEERTLADAIAQGDSDARTRMIRANLRLVVRIARDYTGRGVVLEDLIGEGNIGLIRAAGAFESRFGTRFSTYASFWIKQSIRVALLNTTSVIRLPSHIVALLTKWRRAERKLCRERGREPSFGDVATLLGLTDVQKAMVAKAHQAVQVKLESSVAAETGRWLPVDSTARYDPPDAAVEVEDERGILLNRMQRLDIRERTILTLRYGLGGASALTLKEISERLNVTREWVRKIELRAVNKLMDRPVKDQAEEWSNAYSHRSIQRLRNADPVRFEGKRAPSSPSGKRTGAQVRARSVPRAPRLGPEPPAASAGSF